MSESTVLGLRVMAGAAVMGILGDLLLRQGPWGVNIFLWLAALVAIITVLLRLQPAAASGVNRWMMLPVLAFGACFAWRASVPLKLMDALGVLVALALASPLPGRARIHLAGLLHYFVAAFTACLLTAAGTLAVIFKDIRWKELSNEGWGRPTLAIGRGVALALPPLLVFGVLLMSADPVFEHLVQGSLHVNFRRLLVDAFVIVFCGWIVAGYLRGMLIGNGLPQELAQTFRPLSLGVFEVGIVLGLVDCLFLAFVAVQVRYLFGGASIVGITPGLTYAEYARRGFIELVMVAALVLPLLLALHWLLRKENPRHARIFSMLAGTQILLLFVIMASAVQRMRLYTEQFGLTEQRLYACAFMAWLAVVFVWFAATVLRGRRERFAFGAMLAGFLLIAALHAANPDSLIARTNLARGAEGKRFDVRYVSGLSADAVPDLVAYLPKLNQENGRILAATILKRWPPNGSRDWRTWNWSLRRAQKSVQSHAAMLQQMSGEPHL
ncbi:MAG TPA: DUF4173 domain-containing protein [Terriglobia bacterium]|nr:DUF4173 domain-containing protein [Terriglobia bacterium]